MSQGQQIIFRPFRLNLANAQLQRGQQVIPLRPKTFAVLQYLVLKPHQLIRKEELLEAVWPDAFVSDGVLKVCIKEIRRALGDDHNQPLYIETAHRLGYRFIGHLEMPAADDAPALAAPRIETVEMKKSEDNAIDIHRREVTAAVLPTKICESDWQSGEEIIDCESNGGGANRKSLTRLVESKKPNSECEGPTPSAIILKAQCLCNRRIASTPVTNVFLTFVRLRLIPRRYNPAFLLPLIGSLVILALGLSGEVTPCSPNRPASMKVSRFTTGGNVDQVALSPDGKYLAYTVREADKQSLWIRHLQTARNTRISQADKVAGESLRFSSDSTYLYFTTDAVFKVSVLGGVPTKVNDSFGSRSASGDSKE